MLGYLEEVKFVCSILSRLECILEFRSPNDVVAKWHSNIFAGDGM